MERDWLIWGRGGGQHIKILLALKDHANLTLLPVSEKWFWSGKSQGNLISHLCENPVDLELTLVKPRHCTSSHHT